MDDAPRSERTGDGDAGGDGEPAGEAGRVGRFVHRVPWKYIFSVLVLLIVWFGIGQLCPPMYWRF